MLRKQYALARVLLAHGPMTVKALGQALGIKGQPCRNRLHVLCRDGIVELGRRQRPALYRLTENGDHWAKQPAPLR